MYPRASCYPYILFICVLEHKSVCRACAATSPQLYICVIMLLYVNTCVLMPLYVCPLYMCPGSTTAWRACSD